MNSKLTKVLLIEDDLSYATLIQRMFSKIGTDLFETAHSVILSDGLDHVSERETDVVLLDLGLPDSQNLETFYRFHAHMPGMPIIILSGLDDAEIAIKAVHEGAQDYLVKGDVNADMLVRAVRYAIERKQTEEILRKDKERYQTILESIPEGYYEVDLDGNLTFFNDAMCKIHGYSRDEFMGMNNREYTDTETAKKVYRAFNQVYKTGQPANVVDVEIIRKDGNKRQIQASISLIKDLADKPIGFRGIARDNTQEKWIRSQLEQAQKMEAIATLAGGVAHQFNNALSPIVSRLDLLEIDTAGDANITQHINPMRSSAQRMAQLTNQLLAYARGGKYQAKTVVLSDFVRDTLPLIEYSLKPSVYVETELPHDILSVKADLTQMQMVLSAILSNATEAIEDKGRIRIVCRNEMLTGESANEFSGLRPGPYASLKIEDDGKGMDAETRNRVFEPFFTTKFQGRGLGMAAAYGILKNHDGFIFINSELGKGTVVHIYLPAVEEEKNEKEAKNPKIDLPKSTGTILMIEDEEIVMHVTHEILERLGYRFLGARNGKEAIDIAKTFDGDIDLAILDIVLPDMGGQAIYPLLMKARPNLKVIVCSGYSIDSPAQEIMNAGAEAFIQKPFSVAEISAKLKEVLKAN